MRTRFIIIIVAIVIVVGAIIYFSIGRAPSNVPVTGQTGSLPGAPAVTGSGILGTGNGSSSVPLGSIGSSVAIIDSGPIAGYFANTTGTVTVVRLDGSVISIANGQSVSLSSSSISGLIAATFSHDGRKIAMSYGSVSNPQTSIFDIQSLTWTQLSMGIISPVWSPLDYRMVYLRNGSSGSESLNVIDLSKTKPVPVALGTWYVQDMALQWTIPGTIILSSQPSAYANTSVLAYDVVKKTITPVVVSRAGFFAIWNAAPQMGLAFSATPAQRGGHLQLIDTSGSVFQSLNFLTLPSKCAFGQTIGSAPSSTLQAVKPLVVTSSTRVTATASSSLAVKSPLSFYPVLYCAVPDNQDTLSYYPLPDAYFQHAISTNDTVYRVNTTNGHIDIVLPGLVAGLDATMLSAAGNKIYFVNWYDKKLYSVMVP